jgi:predicted TIM-barrel fold metal-dependent hydrolase
MKGAEYFRTTTRLNDILNNMEGKMDRRKFIGNSAVSAAGIIAGTSLAGCVNENKSGPAYYDVMNEIAKYRKIDAHAHPEADLGRQIDNADRLGIEKLQISRPSNDADFKPEAFRKNNDLVVNAMKQYPGRYIGFFTLNPVYKKESLEEIKRCVDLGMAGYKGYTQVKVNDPLYYPIIEKLIDLKMIVYLHAECQLGVGGYRMKYDVGKPPNTSIPEDFIDAATRYPEAMFHFAHIGGGFDWEYECKAFKNYPNIFVDTGGSNNEENMIDFAIKYLGEDRIFFGTDNCYHHNVGKIMASDATEAQKKKIFFENYNNILRKGGHNVA